MRTQPIKIKLIKMQILNNNTVSGLIRYRQINYVLNSHIYVYVQVNICR